MSFDLTKQLSTSPKNMFSRIFKAADLNDDGKISLDELNCFLDIIVVVQQRMKVASEFLQELDDNANGIELDEWMDYRACVKKLLNAEFFPFSVLNKSFVLKFFFSFFTNY